MSRDVVVVGGSGLIGAACVRGLLAAGHRVTVVTRGQRPVDAGCTPLIADRASPSSLGAALEGRRFDLTVDLLAYDGADVRRLLDVPGFSPGRYLMISTGQVYLVAADPRPPFVEADAARAAMPKPADGTRAYHNWVYGIGKRAAEHEMLRHRAAGADAIALRLPVVQGRGDPSRRLWAYLQRMLDGGPLWLPEGGHHPARFVWADDVGRLVVDLATREHVPSPAYNLAMPDEPQLRDFLLRVAALAGLEPRFIDCSWEELAAAGLEAWVSPFSGPWCSRPDPGLVRRELRFEPTPSDVWLPDVVRAHLEEPDPTPHPEYADRAKEIAAAGRR